MAELQAFAERCRGLQDALGGASGGRGAQVSPLTKNRVNLDVLPTA